MPEHEQFIVGTGLESDTTISIWSPEGQKLTSVSTYQIEHYDVLYSSDLVLVRGWTSEIKTFQLQTDKTGAFTKLNKAHYLTHSEKPTQAALDLPGLHAVTITADQEQLKLWTLQPSHPEALTAECCRLGLDQPSHCAVLTLRSDNERLRTVVVAATKEKMVVLDRNLQPVKEVSGIVIEALHCFGATKSAVVGTLAGGKLTVWDFTKLVLAQPEYVQP